MIINLSESDASSGRIGRQPLLWPSAAAVAALGAWLLFDADPGINWLIWTAAAAMGLMLWSRSSGRLSGTLIFTCCSAIVIAGAAAVTGSEPLSALICLSVVFLLATAMLVSAAPVAASITLVGAALAPPFAFRHAVVQSLRQVVHATELIRSTRARAWTIGLAITIPVLIIFALLLAGADPTFAAWRDAVGNLFANWDFVPRSIFFVLLLVIVLGAYAYSTDNTAAASSTKAAEFSPWLGSTERLILFGGVVALLWLFLALQLGYFFGNRPQFATSGMTFAEYARRGFAELSVVASVSALLIVVSERFGKRDAHERMLRVLTFALIAAVLLLLGSAFSRVWLYEAAYGFTTSRLYAQVYMLAVAAGLVLLTIEVASSFDAGRLFRRAAVACLVLFAALVYWNHESWIAHRNIDRFASAHEIDVNYLTKELSSAAVPAIIERLHSLPEDVRSEIAISLLERYSARFGGPAPRWYEWNLARSRARAALSSYPG